VLGEFPVTPAAYSEYAAGVANVNVLFYLSQMFELWRGTLVYRFEIAKTSLHYGNLMVAVDFNGSESFALQRAANLYRTYWDITETNELVVEVPFVSPTVLDVASPIRVGDPWPETRMFLVNTTVLGSPPQVASYVQINVYVTAKNIEFYHPCLQLLVAGLLFAGSKGEDCPARERRAYRGGWKTNLDL